MTPQYVTVKYTMTTAYEVSAVRELLDLHCRKGTTINIDIDNVPDDMLNDTPAPADRFALSHIINIINWRDIYCLSVY